MRLLECGPELHPLSHVAVEVLPSARIPPVWSMPACASDVLLVRFLDWVSNTSCFPGAFRCALRCMPSSSTRNIIKLASHVAATQIAYKGTQPIAMTEAVGLEETSFSKLSVQLWPEAVLSALVWQRSRGIFIVKEDRMDQLTWPSVPEIIHTG